MNIAFLCTGGNTFLKHIIAHFRKSHEVKEFRSGTVHELYALMNWADVSWIEWCDQLAIHATQHPTASRVICRLHSYEAFSYFPTQMKWENVDDLIFVAPHIRKILYSRFPDIEKQVKSHIVYNGVDVDKFTFKEHAPGFNIAYVGYINEKKNPGLLLHCMWELLKRDDRYRLHIAGRHQDLRLQLYFDQMVKDLFFENRIVFHGWIDDINAWLQDKDYIVSTSYLESFCYAIAEGMACGIKPVIHNWIGVEHIWPAEYTFNVIDEFCYHIQSEVYDSDEYRQYVVDNYSVEKQIAAIEGVFEY
jgi:glycosyltransferase involved in cell wall biosynthesis